uniref:Uncharacterized protein n=1 Tax=Anguilla anguilla TaxID=7936 RepID=A0A0E9QMU6_ANGAN
MKTDSIRKKISYILVLYHTISSNVGHFCH